MYFDSAHSRLKMQQPGLSRVAGDHERCDIESLWGRRKGPKERRDG
jgi:hypothetical protein